MREKLISHSLELVRLQETSRKDDRPEITSKLAWHALVELASPSLPASIRQDFERMLQAGKRVTAPDIACARMVHPQARKGRWPAEKIVKSALKEKKRSDCTVTNCNGFLEILEVLGQRTDMAKQIQTFGYEGLTISAFIEHLKRSGTKVVIDVRANPLSRKHGFSKKAFSAYLEKAGIQYMHVAGVGCPKPVRDRYKLDGDWSAYTVGFMKYLRSRSEDVAAIAAVATN